MEIIAGYTAIIILDKEDASTLLENQYSEYDGYSYNIISIMSNDPQFEFDIYKNWLQENNIKYHYIKQTITNRNTVKLLILNYVFKNEEDAMAFILRFDE